MDFEPGGQLIAANEACRRASPRQRVFQAAVLAEHADSAPLDCLIRDIAQHGAQLRLNPGQRAPETAYLVNLMSRMAYPANRIWQRGNRAGVSFKGGGRISADLPSDLAFLEAIFVMGKLRQIESLSAQGVELSAALRTCAVSRATYRRWLETFVF